MNKALGMVEYQTVSAGITAADLMIKTANIEILQATVICPGKYITLISGELSAISAAIDAAKVQFGDKLTDSFVLGNPHEDIFPAIYGGANVENAKALGILETFSTPAIIVAADAAAKTSDVTLIELRIARGMGGKSYMLLTGDVAAVSAAIESARLKVGEDGLLLDSSVIPNPDKSLWASIM
ncbi:MAG: BMC domain-containing protein [Ruminococcaceae bacterium]|nr:BMC domain-containing protein [Oscillospiraceae bacterium]